MANKECMNDLLKKFRDTTEPEQNPGADSRKEEVDVQLNLGLSLGGCFGDKPKNESSSLFRSASSSEACFTAAFMKEEVEDVPLTRTSSLPSEPLDARKRKGLLSMMQTDSGMGKKRSGAGAGAVAGEELNPLLRSARGSIGSLGSASSANSFLDYESAHGSGNHLGPRSPASVLPLREQKEQKPTVIPSAENANTDLATRSKNADSSEKPDPVRQESEAKVMADMPCVFTIGDGPNGKRIEGLLFKYKTGEDVKIVCVCHGTFLSPAEFVKHAGGGEVEHPLRHIVVVVPTALSSSS